MAKIINIPGVPLPLPGPGTKKASGIKIGIEGSEKIKINVSKTA